MIPSDHFVRFYNEVFKSLAARGPEHLAAYWQEVGRHQIAELADRFHDGGLNACHDYWRHIKDEENCDADLTLADEYFEFRMHVCPSLSKVAVDNDAAPCEFYCDHCMGWIGPVMEAAGLYAVMDMQSRQEPHCVFRVYRDRAQAEAFAGEASLPVRSYEEAPLPAASEPGRP